MEKLKFELAFVEDGGYGRSVRTPHKSDYFRNALQRNFGWRIDHILATASLADRRRIEDVDMAPSHRGWGIGPFCRLRRVGVTHLAAQTAAQRLLRVKTTDGAGLQSAAGDVVLGSQKFGAPLHTIGMVRVL